MVLAKKMPIFYSALMLTGVNLLLRLVSTSFQVYLSGSIGATGIGLLQLVLSLGYLTMTAGMAGIRTATMYLTAEELGRKNPGTIGQVLRGCIFYSLACSVSVAVAVYAAAPWLAQHWVGHPETSAALRLLAAFLPVVCLTGVFTGYFTAANRIGTLAAVEVAEQLCSMGLTLVLLHVTSGDDPGKACAIVVLGSSLGSCLTFLCLLFLRLREKEPPGPRLPVAGRLRSIAVPLALADDLKAGISTAENLMVPRRLALYSGTGSALAQFGTVCGMVFPVLMFPAAILFALAELLIPELARCNAAGSRIRIRYLVRRSLRTALFYGAALGGAMYLLADDLCFALFGSADAGKYLRWYALLAPMLYCDAITDAMTKGLGQQKICVRNNIITSALDVLGLYILLPKFGMFGYFISFFGTHLLNFLLSLALLTKTTGAVIPLRIPGAVLSVMCFGVWAGTHLTPPVFRVGSYLLIFAAGLVLLGAVTREDLQWIRGLLWKEKGAVKKQPRKNCEFQKWYSQ